MDVQPRPMVSSDTVGWASYPSVGGGGSSGFRSAFVGGLLSVTVSCDVCLQSSSCCLKTFFLGCPFPGSLVRECWLSLGFFFVFLVCAFWCSQIAGFSSGMYKGQMKQRETEALRAASHSPLLRPLPSSLYLSASFCICFQYDVQGF